MTMIKERFREREREMSLLLLSSFFFSILPPLLTKYVSPLPLECVPLLSVWRRSRKRRRRKKKASSERGESRCSYVRVVDTRWRHNDAHMDSEAKVGRTKMLFGTKKQTNVCMNEWMKGGECNEGTVVSLLLPVWPIRQAQLKKSKHV